MEGQHTEIISWNIKCQKYDNDILVGEIQIINIIMIIIIIKN